MTNNQASNEKSAANKLVDLVMSEFEFALQQVGNL